jgi:hypothetical protein
LEKPNFFIKNFVDSDKKRGDNFYMRRYLIIFLLLIFLIACNQSNLPLPDGSTVEIIAYPGIIPVHGGVSTITVIGYEKDGRPLRDGILVNFRTDLGIVEPMTAETKNGKAVSYLKSTGIPGNANVTAWFVGGATVSVVVRIQNHNPVKTLLLTASSYSVGRDGGYIALNGYAFDADNNPVSSAPLIFSTTRGNLSSNGNPLLTDSNGKATDNLYLPLNDTGSELKIKVTLYHGSLSTTIEINQGT